MVGEGAGPHRKGNLLDVAERPGGLELLRALRRGDGLAVWDEVALVNWVSSPESLDQGFAVETPHAADFVRVQGSPNASVDLRLTFSE